jgi:hypothetical protein
MNQWHNDLADRLSLDGEWEFTLGAKTGKINVPGTWEAQDFPRDIDGPAEFQVRVYVPATWQGNNIQLQFDAVSYHMEAQMNGVAIGSHTGLWTPFAFDITDAIRPGVTNTIRLIVYKPGERFPMRESLAGFLPDVCIPFGGMWQSVRLVSFPNAAISDVLLSSDLQSGTVNVHASLHHAEGLTAVIQVQAPDERIAAVWRSVVADGQIAANLVVASSQAWNPEHPALYTAIIRLENPAGDVVAQMQRLFGFRILSREGEQLLLNGAPAFLRGVLNWGWYPEILCPAPDEKTIRDEFRRIRSFGYNMVKLCLYVPSSLYFDIADEEGMLLWLELPLWLPQVTDRLREQAPIEYADILASVQHHPSIVIYSLGCELGAAVDSELLGKLNAILKAKTAGVLVCDNSGSGEAYGGLTFDYADFNDYHFYCDLHHFNPLLDHFRRDWRSARPWIFGEFCDADDYRDLDQISEANDGELSWWLLERNPIHSLSAIAYSQQPVRMPDLNLPFTGQDLQRISRQQSFVVRKTILEKVRAKAGMGGYVVTGLRDTPLATSSMFDDLGYPKYAADKFREFNADAVLVLEQGRARVWKYGGDRPAPVDRNNHLADSLLDFRIVLSHSGKDIAAGELVWQLLDANSHVVESGKNLIEAASSGHVPIEIASITFTAPMTETAQQYRLEVELEGGICNQWPLWIYPAVTTWLDSIAVFDPAGALSNLDDLVEGAKRVRNLADFAETPVLLTSVFTSEVQDYVTGGGRAVVLQMGMGGLPVKPCPFWRESIKLFYQHLILDDFPHQGYANLQFYHLATDCALDTPQLIAEMPAINRIQPLIRRLDARQFRVLDYLVEVQIGAGTMLLSTLRFGGGMGDQVNGLKANIAGRHLMYQMVDYLSSLKRDT